MILIKFLKKVGVSTGLGILVFFSGVENAYGMGLSPIPQTPIPIERSSDIDSTKIVQGTKADNLRELLVRLVRFSIPRLHILAFSEVPENRDIKIINSVGAN